MRKVSFITITGILALWLGGCASEPAPDPNVGQPPSPAPAAPVGQVPVPGQVPAPPAAPFAQPNATASPITPQGDVPPDLISSTDPEQRLRNIQRNRPDPFAIVPTVPVIERPPETEASAPPQAISPFEPPTQGVAPAPLPPTFEPPAFAPVAPPPLPQAELARAVQVTGVVQVGGAVHAIIKSPNEPTSRYVRAGQYLANGQVLVKRIEVNRPEPVVVLEQDGVEVIVAVGEGGPPPDSNNTAGVFISPTQLTASR